MDGIAAWPSQDRAALFEETAAKRSLPAYIIEKDFWVCWTLFHAFRLPEVGERLIFKGGTSLSKVYGLIKRFSEDIDLSLSRKYLGFSGDRDPLRATSGREAQKLVDALQQACQDKITHAIQPALRTSFAAILGENTQSGWTLAPDPSDPQTLVFTYPRQSVPSPFGTPDYFRPSVVIEMGARSDDWPAANQTIQPYAAEEFPEHFANPACRVKALEARRTFWEKATILHAEYHRPDTSAIPPRLSRHYYDLSQLARSAVAEEALHDVELLSSVAKHKKVFFKSAWPRYDEARPGSLHLVPSPRGLATLQEDYGKMQEMFFEDPPSLKEILSILKDLEDTINRQGL